MDQIIVISAFTIGWGLCEFSHLLRASREKKEAIAHALSIFLDNRAQVFYLENMMPALNNNQTPTQPPPDIRALMANTGPREPHAITAHEKALDTLSIYAPVMVSEYRSQVSFSKMIHQLKAIALEGVATPDRLKSLESELSSNILPQMNALATNLASLHSKKLKMEIEAVICQEFEFPDGMENCFTPAHEECLINPETPVANNIVRQ